MLERYCADIIAAHEARDAARVNEAVRRLVAEAEDGADPGELTAALGALSPLIERAYFPQGGHFAVLGGALIEFGADPAAFAEPLGVGLADCAEAAASLLGTWRLVHGAESNPPDPEEPDAADRIVRSLSSDAVPEDMRDLMSDEDVRYGVDAWCALGLWIRASLTGLQHRSVRTGLVRHESIAGTVELLASGREDLDWLVGLLAVLDDEPLIVVHRETGNAYQVTIGGIGDNFQLHTLLAATLGGPAADGLLEGVRPKDEWIAAATDGPLEPPSGPVCGQFNLVDAAGDWIWNEGRPADIPEHDGRRIVVLDPPPYERFWNVGRVYPMMTPRMTLDRILPPDEAKAWLSRVAPAKRI